MVIHDADRAVARNMFQVAVGLVAKRDPSITVREIALDALRMPNASTCRALHAAGRGKDWLPSVIDALAQVGIAAAENVLADPYDVDEKGMRVLEGMRGTRKEATFTSIDGTEWVLQRTPGETDEEYEERLRLFDNDEVRPFSMQEFLGLSDREYRLMKTKWAIIGDIGLMLEDADIDIAALAEAAGEDPGMADRWLRGMVRDVSLDTLAALYDIAAEMAEWPSLEWIIRGNSGDSE